MRYVGTTELWQSIVCRKGEFDEWHAHDCFFDLCENCNVDYLPLCSTKEEGTFGIKVAWKSFEMKTIMTSRGVEKQKLHLAYKYITFDVLIKYLKPKLQFFYTT
jgi:hypothetical protein